MVTSPTDICNLALGHLGEGRIASLNEDSVASRACNLHYDSERREVLRAHRWNFAQKRQVLTRLVERPPFGWTYYYAMPADCLRVNEMNGSEAGDVINEHFVIEGRRLLTDATQVRLVFNTDAQTVSEFDALFVKALALKLAIVLSETIRGTTGKTEQLLQAYERITGPLARRVDANEGRRRKGILPMNSMALLARGPGTGSLVEPFILSGGLGVPTDEEATEETTMPDTFTATLPFFGEAVLDQTFGAYKPSANVELTQIEISAQVAPVGGTGLRIQLVDAFDVNISDAVTLPSLGSSVRYVLPTALTIAADTTIRAKITSVGSTTPGDGINVILSFSIPADE